MDDFPDEQLVHKARNGSVEAFTELARRYQEKVYKTIFGLTRNHLDADDLAQETFMNAFKSIGRFNQKSSFYTWIYRIAVNLTFNFLKRKKREKGREDYEDNMAGPDDRDFSVSSPEKESLKSEFRKKMDEAVELLPLSYRATFHLVVFEGMTHAQAAGILRCSENTVSWRMHKARKLLRAKLKPYFEASDGLSKV